MAEWQELLNGNLKIVSSRPTVLKCLSNILNSEKFRSPWSKIIAQGECDENQDCGPQRACKDYQCVDPCAISCGQGADCTVQNHVAICRCPRGTTGDPFRNCRRFTREEICAPCGANTDCEVSTSKTWIFTVHFMIFIQMINFYWLGGTWRQTNLPVQEHLHREPAAGLPTRMRHRQWVRPVPEVWQDHLQMRDCLRPRSVRGKRQLPSYKPPCPMFLPAWLLGRCLLQMLHWMHPPLWLRLKQGVRQTEVSRPLLWAKPQCLWPGSNLWSNQPQSSMLLPSWVHWGPLRQLPEVREEGPLHARSLWTRSQLPARLWQVGRWPSSLHLPCRMEGRPSDPLLSRGVHQWQRVPSWPGLLRLQLSLSLWSGLWPECWVPGKQYFKYPSDKHIHVWCCRQGTMVRSALVLLVMLAILSLHADQLVAPRFNRFC